jgi:hypothetical protein
MVSAAGAAPGDPVVFRVAVEGTPAPDRLRVATLDTYDGVAWRPSPTFVPVGDLLPARYAAPSGVSGVVRVSLTDAYPSPLVPAPASPVAVRPPGRERLRFDGETGALLTVDPDRGTLRYEVVADGAGGAPTGGRTTELTALPEPVPEDVRLAAAGLPDGPRPRAEALAARLRDGAWGYGVDGAPGHSYARLAHLLATGRRADVAEVATAEQPAAALAVLARLAGIPSRVVVGYDLPPMAPGDEAEVRARQIRAWTELHLDGEGWVLVDPAPPRPRPPARQPAAAAAPTTQVDAGRVPAAAVRPAPDARSAGDGSCPPDAADCRPEPGPGASPGAGRRWVLVAPALVALAAVGVVAGRAVRRRLRRRRRHPARRLAGAWAETVARLRRHGVAVEAALTPAEVAGRAVAHLGDPVGPPLASWARVLDTAVFAAAAPGDSLADQAWRAHDDLVGVLRSPPPILRVAHAGDPRRRLARRR